MVSNYPHEIIIKHDEGKFTKGVYSPDEKTEYQPKCNIQQQKGNHYKDNSAGDSLSLSWTIFCPIFTDCDKIKIGDRILSITAPAGFEFETDHKILSYTVFQKHIEIGV